MQSTRPRKKISSQRSHQDAISAFKKWQAMNPKATRKRQLQMFDMFVDSAALKNMIEKKNGR
jgi:hypothetical protein